MSLRGFPQPLHDGAEIIFALNILKIWEDILKGFEVRTWTMRICTCLIVRKRKQIDLKAKEINWLMGKKSHLSIQNKLLIYKAAIKPIWSYGTELWSCTSKSNTVIMQRFQSKILRATANAPRYVTNHTLHTECDIPYVSDAIHGRINKHHNKLEAHPNPLLEPLIQPVNFSRLKRCWPLPEMILLDAYRTTPLQYMVS